MELSITQKLKIALFIGPAYLSAFTSRRKDRDGRFITLKKWSNKIIKVLGYNLEVNGVENIPKDETVYFVSNHQGTIDPALIIASSPKTMSFISKAENAKLPLFGSWSKTIGVIHFDRTTREGNIYMLRESARQMKKGQSLLIFPEGTRSKCNKMNEFKVGSIQPAYLAKAAIVPVTLNNAYVLDLKDQHNKNLMITYGKPLRYEDYKNLSQQEITAKLYELVKENILD